MLIRNALLSIELQEQILSKLVREFRNYQIIFKKLFFLIY